MSGAVCRSPTGKEAVISRSFLKKGLNRNYPFVNIDEMLVYAMYWLYELACNFACSVSFAVTITLLYVCFSLVGFIYTCTIYIYIYIIIYSPRERKKKKKRALSCRNSVLGKFSRRHPRSEGTQQTSLRIAFRENRERSAGAKGERCFRRMSKYIIIIKIIYDAFSLSLSEIDAEIVLRARYSSES